MACLGFVALVVEFILHISLHLPPLLPSRLAWEGSSTGGVCAVLGKLGMERGAVHGEHHGWDELDQGSQGGVESREGVGSVIPECGLELEWHSERNSLL